jgi:hypothetical protein
LVISIPREGSGNATGAEKASIGIHDAKKVLIKTLQHATDWA